MPFGIDFPETVEPPVYQVIAERARHLRQLGESSASVARLLGVSNKTVARALRWRAGVT